MWEEVVNITSTFSFSTKEDEPIWQVSVVGVVFITLIIQSGQL
jgi:hypothetical protein